MSNENGGFWGFIKRLFGMEKTDSRESAASGSDFDEDFDQSSAEPGYKYDEAKMKRNAEQRIAQSFEDEKANPSDPEIFFQRAANYSILGDNAAALELLDKALAIDAGYIFAYRLKASIADESENYEEVIKQLSFAISLHSEINDADQESGLIPDDDIDETLNRIHRNEKKDDFRKRGVAYFRMENYEPALDDLTKAIALDPDDDFLYSRRSDIYLEMGNSQKALEDLNTALALDEDKHNYANRSAFYKKTGDLEAALQDIWKAIALDEADASDSAGLFLAYFDRAEIYLEKGDYHSAVQDYTREIEKNPTFFGAYEQRAVAYRALGSDSLAEADEEKARELTAEFEDSET